MKIPNTADFRRWLVELFATFNLVFLAVDIYVAHSINEFANPLEWIPVVFSAVVPLALVPGLVTRRFDQGANRLVGLTVGWLSILVGVVGMVLHLESAFFEVRTLESLVYSAPFVAPLAYTGVGLLLVLDRTTEDEWAGWVMLLALGGFIGNFGLSVLDHAQNGFFDETEWIPVFAAAIGVGFVGLAVFVRERSFLYATGVVLVLNALVGLAGFVLHLEASLAGPGMDWWYKIVFGAPIFAPLLFPNIALLAAIALWDMLAEPEPAEAAEEPEAS